MDDNQPDFGPFTPQQPIFDAPAKSDGARKPKGKKAKGKPGRPKNLALTGIVIPHDPTIRTRGGTPSPARKPRKAQAVKIDLTLAMSALAGLTEDDSKFISGVVQAMAAFPIGQKRRIVAALGKLFA